ncbi:conserved hypothetical protein [Histoplasma capsulatum var. duboisii H88]|uniref:Uncharacterized protein n=1 Tax=Ajellomyces capsulatus (strain H88) TaxID=544711 RepID=F0UBJ9_AJEC8|nr:conserved hypothetical protein [Histoplasma capsulatum var. duboisii H88]
MAHKPVTLPHLPSASEQMPRLSIDVMKRTLKAFVISFAVNSGVTKEGDTPPQSRRIWLYQAFTRIHYGYLTTTLAGRAEARSWTPILLRYEGAVCRSQDERAAADRPGTQTPPEGIDS